MGGVRSVFGAIRKHFTQPGECHRYLVIAPYIAPYIAPLTFPYGGSAAWILAMGAFSKTERFYAAVILTISLAAFIGGVGSIVVCLWRGSKRQ